MPNNNVSKTKNTMPNFSRGTLTQLQKAIADGKVVGPAFHFLTESDKKCLAFIDIDNTIYQINLDRIKAIESQLEGLTDPETGESVNVVTYVTESVAPVQTQVTNVSSEIEEIKQNGAAIMLTAKDLGGAE